MSEKTLSLIQKHQAEWIDLRFTDTRGKEQHVSLPARELECDRNFFTNGKAFDGSSITGWKDICDSDMLLMPDDSTAVADPFTDEKTINLRCDVVDTTQKGYERDPRTVARRAEAYMVSTGIADCCFVGPEPEFFVFDSVCWNNRMSESFYSIHSEEAAWSSGTAFETGNPGHRPGVKGGYFPVPPVDSLQNLRAGMCAAIEAMGVPVEVHHHEVATAGQCEIGTRFNRLLRKADEVQIVKYAVHNVAHAYGKTATFMPKPLVGDNGNGMHCHQSLELNGKNLFAGDEYAGLSETALFYIGGIIKHAKALNAFTNASTNSYKRLVPGFEAPVLLAYSARNRSAAIRIPHVSNPAARRIEVRFPDPTANPYLAFSAMLMAGLDGIQNRIHPGDAADEDLYSLSAAQRSQVPQVAASLDEALDALDTGRAFLTQGDVFSDDMIDAYIALKRQECGRLRQATHPVEFELYYSC